ncbi:hypothetical protein A9G25_11915 [Gilliamella sp. Bif1-4]|jgi:hypothetical protein|nr:hypothetical protein A9G25_11915 [Gilliamella apicola]
MYLYGKFCKNHHNYVMDNDDVYDEFIDLFINQQLEDDFPNDILLTIFTLNPRNRSNLVVISLSKCTSYS